MRYLSHGEYTLPSDVFRDSESGKEFVFWYGDLKKTTESENSKAVLLEVDSGEKVVMGFKQLRKFIGRGRFEPLEKNVDIRVSESDKHFYSEHRDVEVDEEVIIGESEKSCVNEVDGFDQEEGEDEPSEDKEGSEESGKEPGEVIYGDLS